METANIISDGRCTVVTDDRLLERGMGEFEGMHHDEYGKGNYWDLNLNNTDKGVESIQALFERTKEFLDYLKTLDCENVLVVSHAATIRAIHFNIIGYDENTKFLEFFPKNGEVYKYTL